MSQSASGSTQLIADATVQTGQSTSASQPRSSKNDSRSQMTRCERPSCQVQFRRTRSQQVTLRVNGGTRHLTVCPKCWEHYEKKSGTTTNKMKSQTPSGANQVSAHRSHDSQVGSSSSSTVNHGEIRKRVSAAQRGNQSNVQPTSILSARRPSQGVMAPPPVPSSSRIVSNLLPQHRVLEGRAPGPAGQGQPFAMPPLAVPIPSALRHPQALEDYRETRELLRKRAQMGGQMEHHVVLKMRLVSRAKKRAVNPTLLLPENRVEHVPSTINKANLMNLVLQAFRGDWLEEYHGHCLEPHHIRGLLDSKQCNLDDDDYPIRDLCLKDGKLKKGKESQFIIVQAIVDASVVSNAEFHKEMHLNEDDDVDVDVDGRNEPQTTAELMPSLTRTGTQTPLAAMSKVLESGDTARPSSSRPQARPLNQRKRTRDSSAEPNYDAGAHSQLISASKDENVPGTAARAKRLRHSSDHSNSLFAPDYVSIPGPNATGIESRSHSGSAGRLTSVPMESIQKALSAQREPTSKDINNLLTVTGVPILFYDCPTRTYDSLVTGPQVATNGFVKWMSNSRPVVASLFYNTGHKPQYGSFKTMRRGRIDPAPFGEPSLSGRVALKQPHDRLHETNRSASLAGGISSIPVEERVSQLFQDALATVWADALLQIVYDFIEHYHSTHKPSQCPWEIPSFRYVRTGIAITNVPNSLPQEKQVYLVEELVDPDMDGKWRKYLNNNTARHRFTPEDTENFRRAEFLTFCQHLQYHETCGQAFISDFQGGRTILSDPQIITNPDLGRDLFCKGNVSDTHRNFEHDHVCNIYCSFFQLPIYAH